MGVNSSFERIRGKGDEKGIMVCRGGLFLQGLQRLIWKQRKRGSIERVCWWVWRRKVLSKEWGGMGGGWRHTGRERVKKRLFFFPKVNEKMQRVSTRVQRHSPEPVQGWNEAVGGWQLVVSGCGRAREAERRTMCTQNQADGLTRGQNKTKKSEQQPKGNWKVCKV